MPEALEYLWAWFAEVMNGVAVGGMAPSVVTWSDLVSWCELTGEQVEPWEARALVQLGALRADILAEAAEEERKKNAGPR